MFDTACGNKHSPDFAMIARGYGISAIHCSHESALPSALEQFINADDAILFHLEIDPRHDVVPMLLGGQTTDKMWPYFDAQGNPKESVHE